MNFQYSVITDNTEEARKWLEMLGYEELHVSNCPCRYLYSTSEGYYLTSPILLTYAENNSINCIGNPQLFQAVSAIREDSDKGKCFVPTDNASELCSPFVVCNTDVFNGEYIEYQGSTFKATRGHYRESSSLSELQERFKEKER